MRSNALTYLLRIDAVANEAGGITLIAAGSWLADPMGLSAAWPLWIVGAILLVNGFENWRVGNHSTTANALRALVAVDIVFAMAMLAVAITDPTGADTWLRWTLAAVADVVLLVAIGKVVGLRSLSEGSNARAAVT